MTDVMQKIIPIFVKAKAWQLFILLFGVPFFAQFILMFGFMGSMFYSYSQDQEGAEASLNQFMVIFGVIFAIFGGLYMAIFLGWFWSLGCFCNSIIREDIRMKLGFLKFCVLYPFFYMFVFLVFWSSSFLNNDGTPIFFFLIFPFHMFAMFCMFYNLYFVSKALVMAEKQEVVKFYDYAGPFFLMWFYPIGVWFVQPRINALYENNNA